MICYPCPIFESICSRINKPRKQIEEDLKFLVDRITGQVFSTNLIFDPKEKPAKTCLTRMIIRGAVQAEKIKPYIKPNFKVLDFGGGIGRISGHLCQLCSHLTSVDIHPLTKEYGPAFWPDISFKLMNELDESFDMIFSVAVFFHLTLEEQVAAMEIMRQHLLPNGICIIDTMLAPEFKISGNLLKSKESDFLNACSSMFNVEEINLFNRGFLLTHK
jgi:2-polyprenyl-3-methyl-5-hydroxy-6-metoxy-1,4-benzoquinol methylase